MADMGEAVPLRRILRAQGDAVVTADIAMLAAFLAKAVVEVALALTLYGMQLRWEAMRRQDPSSGIVERKAEAERNAMLHFGDGGAHGRRRDEVQAAQLVVRAEVAPVGALGSPRPSLCQSEFPFSPWFAGAMSQSPAYR